MVKKSEILKKNGEIIGKSGEVPAGLDMFSKFPPYGFIFKIEKNFFQSQIRAILYTWTHMAKEQN